MRMPNGRLVEVVPVQALRQHRMTQLFGPGDLPIPIEDDGLPGGGCLNLQPARLQCRMQEARSAELAGWRNTGLSWVWWLSNLRMNLVQVMPNWSRARTRTSSSISPPPSLTAWTTAATPPTTHRSTAWVSAPMAAKRAFCVGPWPCEVPPRAVRFLGGASRLLGVTGTPNNRDATIAIRSDRCCTECNGQAWLKLLKQATGQYMWNLA